VFPVGTIYQDLLVTQQSDGISYRRTTSLPLSLATQFPVTMDGLVDEYIATAESRSSVLKWVRNLPDGSDEDKAISRERRGKVLRKAAYHHNIDIVRILLSEANIEAPSG